MCSLLRLDHVYGSPSVVSDVMDGMMDNMDIRGGDSPSWGGWWHGGTWQIGVDQQQVGLLNISNKRGLQIWIVS